MKSDGLIMREKMDGKVIYFPPESAFSTLMLHFKKVLFPVCTLNWRVNNYVSRQEKVKKEKMKIQFQNLSELENDYYYFLVLTIFNQYLFICISNTENCKTPI